MTAAPDYVGLRLVIPGRLDMPCDTLASVSLVYSQCRDGSAEGASTFPDGEVYDATGKIGRVSYNGRIWPPERWTTSMQPLYDNGRDA